MWELEGMDVTTYSALKHAFDILAAAYRSERASHEAEVLRWSMENQVHSRPLHAAAFILLTRFGAVKGAQSGGGKPARGAAGGPRCLGC